MKILIAITFLAAGIAIGKGGGRALYWLFMRNMPETHPDSKPRFMVNGVRVEKWPEEAA